MAKKKPQSRADAVRHAVDQAFQTQIPRERISELLDDLGSTAGRLRGAVDDLRPASVEEVRALGADITALSTRIDALEAAAKAKPKASARRPAAKRAPAAKPRKPAAAKPKPKPSPKPKTDET